MTGGVEGGWAAAEGQEASRVGAATGVGEMWGWGVSVVMSSSNFVASVSCLLCLHVHSMDLICYMPAIVCLCWVSSDPLKDI